MHDNKQLQMKTNQTQKQSAKNTFSSQREMIMSAKLIRWQRHAS